MTVPPRIVRRLVIDPLFVVGAILALGALPIWILVAAFASRFVPGRWRILRVAWFLFLYVALEAAALVLLFAIWIGTGFGSSKGYVAMERTSSETRADCAPAGACADASSRSAST